MIKNIIHIEKPQAGGKSSIFPFLLMKHIWNFPPIECFEKPASALLILKMVS